MSEEQSRNEKLAQAYNRMMERVKEAVTDAEKAAEPLVRKAVDAAEEKAVELGELTREEAEKIGEYLRRDLQSAAEYLAGPEGQELKDWLKFDIELIEERMLEMFLQAADRTKLEMLDFEESLIESGEYRTGEITGPGTLTCTTCGEAIHFHETGHIPPCPKCHGSHYSRG